jgi:hypothetical protein
MYRLKVLDEDVSRRNLKDFDGVSFLRPIKSRIEPPVQAFKILTRRRGVSLQPGGTVR